MAGGDCWERNAGLWMRAVREGLIPSRIRATNAAVVDAMARLGARTVLDIGCGEGWLARQIPAVRFTGFDASAELIEAARRDSPGEFHVLSYEAFVRDPRAVGGPFDAAVANFSLFDADVTALLGAAGEVSEWLVVQTLHPSAATAGRQVERFDSLASLGGWAPMEWHNRSREEWESQIEGAGWRIAQIEEPAGLSLLISARRVSSRGTEKHEPRSIRV